MLAAYISTETQRHGAVQADNNWRLATFSSQQPLDIRFETSPPDSDLALI
ncbi:hypothetical protein J4732_02035 [Serratia marcescens]|uniref:Uncharacterized protein n=1 Tax=Serratia marcescens TaxID=615 RepID=A0A939NSR8_SERMA|nr:hypothetical protein [Serratia marcescens]